MKFFGFTFDNLAVRCVLSFVFLTFDTAALAQTAGEIAERSFAPEALSQSASVVFSGGQGLGVPEGAEKVSVVISKIQLEGPFSTLGLEASVLDGQLLGRRVAVSEIFEAAQSLEEAIVTNGHVLARVVLPAQTLEDGGVLRIVVVDGFVEAIDAETVQEPVRDRLAAIAAPLVDNRDIKLSDLERQILIAGDTYGVALSTTLAPGQKTGGTVISLDAEFKRVTGSLGLNNLIPEGLGEVGFDLGLEINSGLGLGETFYGRLSGASEDFGTDQPDLRTLAVGGLLPIGTDGLTFNLEAAQTDSTLDRQIPYSVSQYSRVSARLTYPLQRSRMDNVSATVEFDATTDTLDILAGSVSLPVHEDKLRVLRFGGTGSWQSESGGIFALSGKLSFGLDVPGARTLARASQAKPLSREGADATFTKLEVSTNYATPLGDSFGLSFSGSAQTSFGDPLLVSEQFGIAKSSLISPFSDMPGGLSGDSGMAVRAEVSWKPQRGEEGSISFSPYVFLAAGGVRRENPEADEDSRTSAEAAGFGVDFFWDRDDQFSNAFARVELGRGTSDDRERTSLFIFSGFRF